MKCGAGRGGPAAPVSRSNSPRRSISRTTCPTIPLARCSVRRSVSFSSTTGRTPASASSQASIRPLGPAPAMTTSSITKPPILGYEASPGAIQRWVDFGWWIRFGGSGRGLGQPVGELGQRLGQQLLHVRLPPGLDELHLAHVLRGHDGRRDQVRVEVTFHVGTGAGGDRGGDV